MNTQQLVQTILDSAKMGFDAEAIAGVMKETGIKVTIEFLDNDIEAVVGATTEAEDKVITMLRTGHPVETIARLTDFSVSDIYKLAEEHV